MSGGGLVNGPGVVLEQRVKAPMQGVAAVVGVQLVGLALKGERCVLDAVCHSADDAAKIGRVVLQSKAHSCKQLRCIHQSRLSKLEGKVSISPLVDRYHALVQLLDCACCL